MNDSKGKIFIEQIALWWNPNRYGRINLQEGDISDAR
jgi:hypothetical protein